MRDSFSNVYNVDWLRMFVHGVNDGRRCEYTIGMIYRLYEGA